MATFDIFIKGINPERESETEEIRVNAANALKISVEKLDELLAQPNGVRIRRDAPEQEAINYQRALSKLGLVCLYSPTKILTNLELEPIEEEIIETSVTCPHCEHEMAVEDEIKPEKCTECGIDIQKFLDQKRQNEEREAMKAKLLASQAIIKAQEEKKLQEEALKERKAKLEKEVLQELGVELPQKKPLNVKLLAIGGSLVVAVVSASYFSTSSTSPKSAPAQALQLATPNAKETKTQNTAVNNSQIAAPLNAQQAMQKTHDQAAQVLNSFGLNADAFANAGSNTSPNVEMMANDEVLSAVDNALNPPQSSTTQNISNSQNNGQSVAKTFPEPQAEKVLPPVNLPALFAALKNDTTWDKFLAQNSKILLERQLPEKALQLSKFIISNDVYISVVGQLLRAATQSKQTQLSENYLTALNTRLEKLPLEAQAVYFSSVAAYLPPENGTNSLFVKSENLLARLPTPQLQLPAVLKLAVSYFKVGNTTNSNNYFNKINDLLTPITDLDLQAQLRANVALAYQEVGNTSVAMQWLSSLEPLIKQLKPETIKILALNYAKCNEWQKSLNVLSQLDFTNRETTLYRAIQTSLDAGFLTSAIELQKSQQSPVYKTLTNVLIAEYSTSPTPFLVSAEKELVNFSATEKILVASQLVDYYGRLKNAAKVEEFLKMSQDALENSPASDEKDALLEAVIEHFLHGFQGKMASNLLVAIQTTSLKMQLNIEINELANVGALLK